MTCPLTISDAAMFAADGSLAVDDNSHSACAETSSS